jgi:hypothetical protein
MATLEKNDAEIFYKIMNELIYFANSRFKLIPNFEKPGTGKGWKEEDIYKITEKIFSKIEIITSFCSENPAMFSKDKLEIADSWKKFVKDKFIVFSDKGKIIFLSSEDEAKSYEVYGIYDEILDLVPFEPVMVEAILIPFKGKITFIGSFKIFPVHFGGGFKKGLITDYGISKNKFGIISSLDGKIEEKNQSNEELLRFYMKNKNNRDEFWKQIHDLIKKEPVLKNVFHNEIGRSCVRDAKKVLNDLGVKEAWFAIANTQIITAGKSENEVKERLKEILSENKLTSAYIFKYGANDEN